MSISSSGPSKTQTVPYTLTMFLLWGFLMALTGGVIGWMLCKVRSRARRARDAARETAIDTASPTG